MGFGQRSATVSGRIWVRILLLKMRYRERVVVRTLDGLWCGVAGMGAWEWVFWELWKFRAFGIWLFNR